MATIRIIVEEHGQPLLEKSYVLPEDLGDLDAVDQAVEVFKNQALPQIEMELLAKATERSVSEVKKTLPGA